MLYMSEAANMPHYVEPPSKKFTSAILLIQVLKEPLGSVLVGKKIFFHYLANDHEKN